jgi:plasmid stability protein
MKNFEIPNLPDDVYARIERRAQQVGRSPAEVAADILAREVAGDERDAALMAEIREEREAMAARGVFLTEEFLTEAINRRRE